MPPSASTKPKALRFRIGVLLLIINFPFGYVGLAIGTALFAKTHRFFWQAVGIGCYALSWAMLGLGIWMAGPAGKRLAVDISRRFVARFRRNHTPRT